MSTLYHFRVQIAKFSTRKTRSKPKSQKNVPANNCHPKVCENEHSLFQNLIGSLERSRAAMAEDLANLSAQNETLKTEVETIPSLKQKL
jgi:hypothetical protein